MAGTPPEGEQHLYKITMFIHKVGATTVKDAKYFKRILLTDFPYIFPSNVTEDFIQAGSKQSSKSQNESKQVAKKPTSDWDWMDQQFKNSTNNGSSVYVIGWGKGGRGSVGWTRSWYGAGGCKERTNRVSGAVFKSVPNPAAAFEYLAKWYGVHNDEELDIFHRNVPHNETNGWPTWSPYFPGMPHRYGAAAFTYVEYDDDEVLACRMAATKYYTGSEDGVISNRNQLTRPPMFQHKDDDSVDSSDDEDGGPSGLWEKEGKPKDDADYDEYDEDPIPNSQTYFSDDADGNGKRRRTKTPSPTNKNSFTNSDWAIVVNPTCLATIHDLKSHAMHFPSFENLTDFQFVSHRTNMDTRDRTIMAVFAVDERTAEAYAHWVEHRGKLLFNVHMQTEVLCPAFKGAISKVDCDLHEETLAVNELTEYAKTECPLDRHAEFKAYIPYCNHPAALVTKLITEWKVTERIKELNTKRASPKSALDFDVHMTEVVENPPTIASTGPGSSQSTATGDNVATADVTAAAESNQDNSIDDASIDLLIDTDTELLP